MPDNSLLILLSLMALLFGALGINHFLYRKEQTELERRRLFQAYKQRVETLLHCLATLKQTPCSQPIIDLLNQHCLDLIAQLKSLSPAGDHLDQLTKQTSRPQESPEQPVQITSDRAIKEAQACIREVLRTLRQLKQRAKLSPADYTQFHDELVWLYVVVEADAHISQGKKLLKTGKRPVALTHFKHAKVKLSAVSQSKVADQKKARLLELQELIQQAGQYSESVLANAVSSSTKQSSNASS